MEKQIVFIHLDSIQYLKLIDLAPTWRYLKRLILNKKSGKAHKMLSAWFSLYKGQK